MILEKGTCIVLMSKWVRVIVEPTIEEITSLDDDPKNEILDIFRFLRPS